MWVSVYLFICLGLFHMELIQVKSANTFGDMTRAETLEHVLCCKDNAVSFKFFSPLAVPHLKGVDVFCFKACSRFSWVFFLSCKIISKPIKVSLEKLKLFKRGNLRTSLPVYTSKMDMSLKGSQCSEGLHNVYTDTSFGIGYFIMFTPGWLLRYPEELNQVFPIEFVEVLSMRFCSVLQ